uniref:histidine kinase n=1 Tax=Acidobacterium capsulatum TaxID=33075 RepID=A0A7V4XQG3_9BACT
MGSSRVLLKKTPQNFTLNEPPQRHGPVAGDPGLPPQRHGPVAGDDTARELEAVCSLVAGATELDLHRKPGAQLAERIRAALGLEAAAIFDADLDEIYPAGEWWPGFENQLRNICIFSTVRDEEETGLRQRVLRIRNLPIGALLLRGEASAAAVNAVASLVAVTFDRYHSLANETRIESARRTEQLRTTVLDNLAHAYKTPLTAIRAASTGLAEIGEMTPAQSSLLALVDEQTTLLNDLTTRLLQTARLEAHEIALHLEPVGVLALMEEVVAGLREPLEGMPVTMTVPREDLALRGDRSLLRAMLTQFVDNAAKYAHAGSPVTLAASEEAGAVVLSVHNFGPAIPAAEQEHVFDRYFRATGASRMATGTGIGLSIARRAAQAHGGDVWVTSDEERGTTFFASLPFEAQELQAS